MILLLILKINAISPKSWVSKKELPQIQKSHTSLLQTIITEKKLQFFLKTTKKLNLLHSRIQVSSNLAPTTTLNWTNIRPCSNLNLTRSEKNSLLLFFLKKNNIKYTIKKNENENIDLALSFKNQKQFLDTTGFIIFLIHHIQDEHSPHPLSDEYLNHLKTNFYPTFNQQFLKPEQNLLKITEEKLQFFLKTTKKLNLLHSRVQVSHLQATTSLNWTNIRPCKDLSLTNSEHSPLLFFLKKNDIKYTIEKNKNDDNNIDLTLTFKTQQQFLDTTEFIIFLIHHIQDNQSPVPYSDEYLNHLKTNFYPTFNQQFLILQQTPLKIDRLTEVIYLIYIPTLNEKKDPSTNKDDSTDDPNTSDKTLNNYFLACSPYTKESTSTTLKNIPQIKSVSTSLGTNYLFSWKPQSSYHESFIQFIKKKYAFSLINNQGNYFFLIQDQHEIDQITSALQLFYLSHLLHIKINWEDPFKLSVKEHLNESQKALQQHTEDVTDIRNSFEELYTTFQQNNDPTKALTPPIHNLKALLPEPHFHCAYKDAHIHILKKQTTPEQSLIISIPIPTEFSKNKSDFNNLINLLKKLELNPLISSSKIFLKVPKDLLMLPQYNQIMKYRAHTLLFTEIIFPLTSLIIHKKIDSQIWQDIDNGQVKKIEKYIQNDTFLNPERQEELNILKAHFPQYQSWINIENHTLKNESQLFQKGWKIQPHIHINQTNQQLQKEGLDQLFKLCLYEQKEAFIIRIKMNKNMSTQQLQLFQLICKKTNLLYKENPEENQLSIYTNQSNKIKIACKVCKFILLLEKKTEWIPKLIDNITNNHSFITSYLNKEKPWDLTPFTYLALHEVLYIMFKTPPILKSMQESTTLTTNELEDSIKMYQLFSKLKQKFSQQDIEGSIKLDKDLKEIKISIYNPHNKDGLNYFFALLLTKSKIKNYSIEENNHHIIIDLKNIKDILIFFEILQISFELKDNCLIKSILKGKDFLKGYLDAIQEQIQYQNPSQQKTLLELSSLVDQISKETTNIKKTPPSPLSSPTLTAEVKTFQEKLLEFKKSAKNNPTLFFPIPNHLFQANKSIYLIKDPFIMKELHKRQWVNRCTFLGERTDINFSQKKSFFKFNHYYQFYSLCILFNIEHIAKKGLLNNELPSWEHILETIQTQSPLLYTLYQESLPFLEYEYNILIQLLMTPNEEMNTLKLPSITPNHLLTIEEGWIEDTSKETNDLKLFFKNTNEEPTDSFLKVLTHPQKEQFLIEFNLKSHNHLFQNLNCITTQTTLHTKTHQKIYLLASNKKHLKQIFLLCKIECLIKKMKVQLNTYKTKEILHLKHKHPFIFLDFFEQLSNTSIDLNKLFKILRKAFPEDPSLISELIEHSQEFRMLIPPKDLSSKLLPHPKIKKGNYILFRKA